MHSSNISENLPISQNTGADQTEVVQSPVNAGANKVLPQKMPKQTPTDLPEQTAPRRNQGQTGPKSVAGKNRSKFNALKIGLHAKSKVLPFENQREYDRHLKLVLSSLDPQDLVQANIAQQIADSLWRGMRQELRASLHRDSIFKGLTPQMMAGFLQIKGERAQLAPHFLVDPNFRFGRKALALYRQLYAHYQYWEANSKGVANYQMVWRHHETLFIEFDRWLKTRIAPDLFMSNGQGLHLAWQKHPRELEKYLVEYGYYLWYVTHFEGLRESIRTWMAIWYFVQNRHAEEVDRFDEVVIKERRTCQSLLDTYLKLRKSQIEHTLIGRTQFVISRPHSLATTSTGN